jgi:CelD/BcsL family acetyltransferase involved in cellulose biosynthesis
MLKLEQVDLGRCDWERMDAFADRQVFQTKEWLEFVASTQQAEPIVCAVTDGSSTVGYFTGLTVRRFGVRILGSPFPGWTTFYMGFNLEEGVSRREAAAALRTFAFRSLGCLHLELRDRYALRGELEGLGFGIDRRSTFEVDLRDDEEEIFSRMTSACRRCIRKAEKSGVTVEEAHDVGFADDYFSQLEDVFAKQGLRPTYGVERVRALITHLHPSGRLLLLRARSEEGRCIATGIFPAHGRTMFFWGGASWRSDQILRPNEALFWHALRYWKSRGVSVFDLGGGGDYKRKYGGQEIMVPLWVRSRVPGLSAMRHLARSLHDARRRLTGARQTSGASDPRAD